MLYYCIHSAIFFLFVAVFFGGRFDDNYSNYSDIFFFSLHLRLAYPEFDVSTSGLEVHSLTQNIAERVRDCTQVL